ncbi:hypothetical protein CHS0354_011192 [Potamilus streckersoni]|uniref:Glutaredoxin-2, mitochondrial n=1 Tax=Potamilus streckersoni TaxID=2493646 RepID=A0AAE0S109_9BIVA|nr:hypothetical protein CHS0354_011192 [Potamilus streckersoni]
MGVSSSSPGVDLNSVEAKFIREKIAENCVVIFSKTQCPYCTQAKGIFKNLNVSYEVVELDKITNGPEVGAVLVNMTNARTVPRVFVKGQCVGGASETIALYKSGQLAKMVEGCS